MARWELGKKEGEVILSAIEQQQAVVVGATGELGASIVSRLRKA